MATHKIINSKRIKVSDLTKVSSTDLILSKNNDELSSNISLEVHDELNQSYVVLTGNDIIGEIRFSFDFNSETNELSLFANEAPSPLSKIVLPVEEGEIIIPEISLVYGKNPDNTDNTNIIYLAVNDIPITDHNLKGSPGSPALIEHEWDEQTLILTTTSEINGVITTRTNLKGDKGDNAEIIEAQDSASAITLSEQNPSAIIFVAG